ncbi:MAG TPA: TlpA disulfide reductase family protein [Pedobacter sp.]|jgi:thiol-disulfide isomerase/thioredoxin
MKKSKSLVLLLLLGSSVLAQSVKNTPLALSEVVTAVGKAQKAVKTAEYTLERVDTLLNSNTRVMTGKVIMQVIPADTILGYRFFSRQDGDPSELVYDGHIAYLTDPSKKQYQMYLTQTWLRNLRNMAGGRLLMPDFIKLDTSNAHITLEEDDKYYYLLIRRQDLPQYDIVHRRKTITIEKSKMLPVAVREHQESLGKTQDLFYRITMLKINQQLTYNFSSPSFLKDFTLFTPPSGINNPMWSLLEKEAPAFSLTSFDGGDIKLKDVVGKVVLLDFWEVWCGPCIEALPKIEALYKRYNRKGLEIYGITNDLKQVDAAKRLFKSRSIQFPVLSGSAKLKSDYKFSGDVPMYVLINKSGKVVSVSRNLDAGLEEAIVKELNGK